MNPVPSFELVPLSESGSSESFDEESSPETTELFPSSGLLGLIKK